VAGGDGRLEGVRPGGSAQLVHAFEQRQPSADEQLVPAGAVLVHQEHGFATGTGSRVEA
jgi:hypothetical protein